MKIFSFRAKERERARRWWARVERTELLGLHASLQDLRLKATLHLHEPSQESRRALDSVYDAVEFRARHAATGEVRTAMLCAAGLCARAAGPVESATRHETKSDLIDEIDAAVAATRDTIAARLRELDAIVGDREPLARYHAARRDAVERS